MDSYNLYEDLSLFNGDLLAGFPLLADEEPPTSLLQAQDGLTSTTKIEAPIAPKTTAKVVLGHPQQGSADLGLADLLASSPTKDLANPLESAWMDTKVDLLDLLTSDTESPSLQQVAAPTMTAVARPMELQLALPASPGTGAAVVPSTSAPTTPDPGSMEGSLDILQNLLSADVKVDNLNFGSATQSFVPGGDVQEFAFTGQSDQLDFMDMDTTGLEDLLATELDVSIEGPILSPVSADDVESLLSSSPPSPGNGLTSFIDTLDTSHNASQVDSAYSSLNVSAASETGADDYSAAVFDNYVEAVSPGPERTAKNTTRSQPYGKSGGRKAKNVERKERKKEQNRSAALRYRQKKKEEQGTVFEECDKLENRNKELKDKVDSISREINYLKDLLAEVYKAKGLVPKKSLSKILKK